MAFIKIYIYRGDNLPIKGTVSQDLEGMLMVEIHKNPFLPLPEHVYF